MTDTAAEPIALEAFLPAELLMDANARTDAEATVDKAFTATLKAHAAASLQFPLHEDPAQTFVCGNYVPVTLVRRPDGQLRVRTGHRRTLGCISAGVAVLGFIAGDEGDKQADRRARLIEQWNENHNRQAMTVSDDTAVLLALFDEEGMTEAAIARATGLPRPQITASLTVARSQTAARAADRWEFLTLDQAAALAEFDGDHEALTALVQAAKDSSGQFDHTAERLRGTTPPAPAGPSPSRTSGAGHPARKLPTGPRTTPKTSATSSSLATRKPSRRDSRPAGRSAATCAPTRTSTGTATCTAGRARHRPVSSSPPRTRPPRPPARPRSAAASGSGTPSGGPRTRSAPPTSRRCWHERPRRTVR
jgi:hypothetical protein